MILAALLPLLAQAAIPQSIEEIRLTACLDQAQRDTSTAIVTASGWLGDASGAERAFPQECLGVAYTRLLRWDAAERAFLAAYQLTPADNFAGRAKLAAMAGNAAMGGERPAEAPASFQWALEDARAGNDTAVAGDVEIDRARALVALGQTAEAGEALAAARRDAPQNFEGWLLSATLSRRMNMLDQAQAQINTAALLNPRSPEIGLEAGVIAIMAGREAAALQSWQSVIDTAPGSPAAAMAHAYLDQIRSDGK